METRKSGHAGVESAFYDFILNINSTDLVTSIKVVDIDSEVLNLRCQWFTRSFLAHSSGIALTQKKWK